MHQSDMPELRFRLAKALAKSESVILDLDLMNGNHHDRVGLYEVLLEGLVVEAGDGRLARRYIPWSAIASVVVETR